MMRSMSMQQLIGITFPGCVLLLAIASSLVISKQSGDTVQRRLQDEGMRLVESLAQQSTLSLLYESRDSAAEVVRNFLDFPDVQAIELLTVDGARLYASDAAPAEAPTLSQAPAQPLLFNETSRDWIFVAPVYSGSEQTDSPFTSRDKQAPELIGSVRLTMSKRTLLSMQNEIVQGSIAVGLALSAMLLLLLLSITSRVTNPIRKLSQIMRRAQDGETDARASLEGTREIVNMQQAFNTMMEVLRSREEAIAIARDEALEREKDLKIARDQAIERGEALKIARDQALESARAKGEFAATVSHELRTPLNGVIGMLDLVVDMELGAKQAEYVHTARNSADMLLNLINDILTFSKIDAGKTTLEVVDFDLREKVEEVLALVAPQAQAKELEVAYVIEENIPPHVVGDVHHLGQVLLNLVGNAVKFTDSGDIGVMVSMVSEDQGHVQLRFEVTDSGVGIPFDVQQNIFEAFSQADSSTTRRYGGTGLGLSISRQLVQLMGGEIAVESQPGIGSRFWFDLPFIKSKQNAAQIRAAVPLSSNASVLLCDDNALVRRSVASLLIGERVKLTAVESTVAAVQCLQQGAESTRFDVVILDDEMADTDFAAANSPLARAIAAGARHLVRLSVRPRPRTNWSSQVRVSHSLAKPIRKSTLAECLRTLLTEPTPAPQELAHRGSRNLRETFHNTRVLVVEDNRANQEVALGMLERLGCTAVVAEDGLESIERLRHNRFDLVLMDCHMPRMDGFEATRRIREMGGPASQIPIIAMTANVQKSTMEQCQAVGMNDYLSKPVKLSVLRDALNRWTITEPVQQAPAAEPPESRSGNSVIDQAFLADLREQIGDAVDRILGVFIEDLPGYIDRLREASRDCDSLSITRIAHTIKGAAANIGANRLSEKALQLEEEASSGVKSSYEGLVSALIYESNLVRHVIARSESTVEPEAKSYADGRTLRNLRMEKQSRILVVDDDRGSRFALRETLLGEGHEILEASNGQQAIEICRESVPDLILLDGMMPVMDGFQSCAAIRSMPDCESIPILMITGLNDETSVDKAFAAGATDYITKPINYAVLRRRIEGLLRASSAERQMHRLAYVDSLTGLPNRRMFNEHIAKLFSQPGRGDNQFALMFLDLDRFKMVNDTLGHEAGDLLLKYFGERISGCVRKGDLVARFGGDEFCIMLDRIKSYEVVTGIAEKIHDHLSRPFVFMGREMHITTSIGIAIYPDHGSDASALLKAADIAMYRAKEAGDRYQFYESHLETAILHRLDLENDLRNAVERDELVVYFQPQEHLETGRITALEALIRWQHPQRGLVSPAEFIHLAEETGLIGEIGHWVLCAVCNQVRDWIERGLEAPRVAINLSARQLANPLLASMVREVIQESGLEADRIEFEITESTIMDRPDEMIGTLNELKTMGARIAIDDFGTGYSSLSYLKRFPIDYIKIDRAFVSDVMSNRIDADIVRAIIALARALEVEVIAEGVETPMQRQFLKDHQCDYAQGFLLSRPSPAAEIERRFLRPANGGKLVHFPKK